MVDAKRASFRKHQLWKGGLRKEADGEENKVKSREKTVSTILL